MTEFSYTVTHIDSATDITAFVEWLEWTEIGTGEITHATIRLNTFGSKFISAAPIIDQFHKIRLQATDADGLTFDRVYEVDTMIPIESRQEGNSMDIELLGLEWHLQKTYFAKPFYFESAYEVVKDIGDLYNDSNASLDPALEDHNNNTGNKLPKWTANIYDFNIAEKMTYDGMNEVVDRLGNTVAAGGGGDFWELFFIKHPSDNAKFLMRTFVSGSNPAPGSEITLRDVDEVNGDPAEGGISATPATVVASWGADTFGTLPPDTSNFHGTLEAFHAESQWVNPATSGQPYPQDASVQYLGVHYESNINNNSSTPPTNWTVKEEFDHLGASEYSPWTNNKASHWKNSGSNPIDEVTFGFGSQGCWDANLIVWDLDHYRSQVVQRMNNPANIDVNYLYGQTSAGIYRGFRVLVDPGFGTLGGVFAGNDSNNVPFSGNVAMYDGTKWIVKRVTKNGEEVAVTHEGSVYEKITGVWTDVHTTEWDNDCFHEYSSLINTAGVNSTWKTAGHTTTYGDTSAIQVTYSYNPVGAWVQHTASNYYKCGAWLNLRFPFPFSTHNSVPTLGVLYGNNATKKEPVTLDANNMHLTHSGLQGFNNDESEDLGPLSAISFAITHEWLDPAGALMTEGDFKYRVAFYDTSENVAISDFVVAFNNIPQDVSLPLSSFQIYRARIPWRYKTANIVAKAVLNSIDIVNVFEWRNIKSCVIQWQEAYDAEGRYFPLSSRIIDHTYALSLLLGGTHSTVSLTVDRFCFSKPLLSVTPKVTTGRALMMNFRQNPFIANKIQLDQDALSWLEVANFRHKQYDIRTEGSFNIGYGDTFFLEKADLVADSDTRTADSGGNANTIRLVAKKIKYKINKTSAENGNFLRWIMGIKRIVA